MRTSRMLFGLLLASVALVTGCGGGSSGSLSDSATCSQWINASYDDQQAYAATRTDLGSNSYNVINTECGGAVVEPDPSAPDYVGPQTLGDVVCGVLGVGSNCVPDDASSTSTSAATSSAAQTTTSAAQTTGCTTPTVLGPAPCQ